MIQFHKNLMNTFREKSQSIDFGLKNDPYCHFRNYKNFVEILKQSHKTSHSLHFMHK